MKLEATDCSPLVVFDKDLGELKIEGSSVHENADEFYSPLQEAVEDYLTQAGTGLKLHFYLVYFNTSSSKYFLDIMKTMEEAALGNGAKVSLTWEYDADDLDMKEAGEDYSALLQIPVRLLARERPKG